MRIKVFKNEIIEIALKIAEKEGHKIYRYDYALLKINKHYQIVSIELHYSDSIDLWKHTVKINQVKNYLQRNCITVVTEKLTINL